MYLFNIFMFFTIIFLFKNLFNKDKRYDYLSYFGNDDSYELKHHYDKQKKVNTQIKTYYP